MVCYYGWAAELLLKRAVLLLCCLVLQRLKNTAIKGSWLSWLMYQKVLFKTLYLFLRIHFNRTYTRADSTRGQRITGFETRDGHSVRHSGSRECDHPSWQLPGTKLTWLHCRITASASSAKQFLVQNWQYMSKNFWAHYDCSIWPQTSTAILFIYISDQYFYLTYCILEPRTHLISIFLLQITFHEF